MGYWNSRIPVEIINRSKRDIAGEPVKLSTGSGKGELNLEGKDAGALRIVNSEGIGLLCKIVSPGNKIISEGPVPARSEIILPVTAKAGKTGLFFIYSGNKAAWPVGAVLGGDPALSRHPEKDIKRVVNDSLVIIIRPTETISLKEEISGKNWPEDKMLNIRVPVRMYNFSEKQTGQLPVYVKMEQVFNRLHDKKCGRAVISNDDGTTMKVLNMSNAIMFEDRISPLTEKTVYAFYASDGKQEKAGSDSIAEEWLGKQRNMVRLSGPYPGTAPVDKKWKQDIPVTEGKSYMFGALVKCCGGARGAMVRIDLLGKDGKEINKHFVSNETEGNCYWTFVSGIFRATGDAVNARLTLVSADSVTAQFKGMIFMEAIEGYSSSMFFDQREAEDQHKLAIWPVNSVKKVFHEDLPPTYIPPAEISLAGNEYEPLQIALRSPRRYSNVRVEVSDPVNISGIKPGQVSKFLVGYVPIDYPSNYYERKVPYWYLKYPDEPAGSDGWAGYWPDPLLPYTSFNLESDETQSLWIELYTPAGTESGLYSGSIKVFTNDSLITEIPWHVTVRNFSLPQKNSFGALYDYRSPREMDEPGQGLFRTDISHDSLRAMHLSFMAQHRIATGEINPVPKVIRSNGKISIDFSEYDKAAAFYFDKLKNPYAYLPTSIFYLFGWAFPPSAKFGEKPYDGVYPYAEADRGKLRPEYRKAYQDVLRTFWEHLRAKGWADRYVLYLSDEPHMAEDGKADIVAQMKALCDMIHEVDKKIPIYVSTWWFRPEWDGYIDIWGLGFNGDGDYGHGVTKEDFDHITASGGRIWYTTDGNFCTETPYLAIERLLPWFGFKYGAQAYEFWGVNWLTLNPFKYGWHNYIYESQAPGEESWKRYPNGDGFIIYPGKPVGYDGLIGSIRLKQVREGAEDYEYFLLLSSLIQKNDPGNPHLPDAKKALQEALDMISIPCAMGRYSTKILKNPDDLPVIRDKVAKSIEYLLIK
jgi:hypothetical protein